MSVTVTCEACGQAQQVTSGPDGDTVECSTCGHVMTVRAVAAGPGDANLRHLDPEPTRGRDDHKDLQAHAGQPARSGPG